MFYGLVVDVHGYPFRASGPILACFLVRVYHGIRTLVLRNYRISRRLYSYYSRVLEGHASLLGCVDANFIRVIRYRIR